MERTLAINTPKMVGRTARLKGWLARRRDHGKVAFLDLRDRSGLVQLIVNKPIILQRLNIISLESCIAVTGLVRSRPKAMSNPKLATGDVEVSVATLDLLSKASPLPFELDDTKAISEELRMQYRYLDLRSPRLHQTLKMRAALIQAIRAACRDADCLEVETPYLGKSTPEGARDYLVPTRIMPGAFYALPQSPQQYKQLLMTAGFERYFQIARCFRDEDTRADRQPEFTQLDLELSFTDEDEIMGLVEMVLRGALQELWPDKKTSSFTRLRYDEAMKKYQTDRPELRRESANPDELAFVWITDFPAFERAKDGSLRAVHHPFTEIVGDPPFTGKEKSRQYDLVLNGVELGGGSIRIHDPERLRTVFKFLGHSDKAIELDFGHLLQAFQFGVPPHGGIALGLDRLLMVLQNEPSIREVIAFPKTADGRDLLMGAPAPVTKAQLAELGLGLTRRRKKHG